MKHGNPAAPRGGTHSRGVSSPHPQTSLDRSSHSGMRSGLDFGSQKPTRGQAASAGPTARGHCRLRSVFRLNIGVPGVRQRITRTRASDAHSLGRTGLTPDVTFLFDLTVSQGLRRRLQSKDVNRLDQETAAFHQRVRKGFLSLAQQSFRRIHTINAGRSAHTIARQLITLVDPLIEEGLKTRRLTFKRS